MIFKLQVADLEDEDTTDDFADEEEIESAEEITDPQEYFDNEEEGDDDEDTPLSECGKFLLKILLWTSVGLKSLTPLKSGCKILQDESKIVNAFGGI